MPRYTQSRGSFGLHLANGNIPKGGARVHKFGRNTAVGTTFIPITLDGIYRTPQVGSATQLRVKAGNAADTAAGAGARKIVIEGIIADGNSVIEELTTAGASASSNSVYSYVRVYRAYVSESGTYASSSAGSHTADIVIENAAGTEDWITIASNGFPRSQSEVAAYTVPKGKKAFLTTLFYGADDKTKIVELVFFIRENILETAAPYSAMRTQFTLSNTGNTLDRVFDVPLGPFPELTDIGVMAKVDSGSTEVHADFDIILLDSDA